MTSTDLKPGDIVQHPEKGNGIVLRLLSRHGIGIVHANLKSKGIDAFTGDLSGWERVETLPPGHVAVRVDDLELGATFSGTEDEFVFSVTRDFPEYSEGDLRLIYRALDAQRAESTPPADEPDASATEAATYQCPWCSTDVTFSLRLDRHPGVGVMVWVAADGGHTCPPAQPDEPTEFGARVTVTDDLSGKAERWCRQHDEYWASENGALTTWAYLTQRGAVTLGWEALGWDE